MRLLDRVVLPTLLWCAGSLNTTRRDLQLVNTTHTKMLRKMVGVKPRPRESLAEALTRVATIARDARARARLPDWRSRFHMARWRWAGHLARINSYDPTRLSVRAMKWRNWNWLRDYSKRNGGRQHHGRQLRTWRWEYQIYKFQPDWWDEGKDLLKSEWASRIPIYLDWVRTIKEQKKKKEDGDDEASVSS